MLAQGAAQQLLDAAGDLVEAEDFRVDDVTPGEDQELASEPGCPLRRAADLLDVGEQSHQPLVAAAHHGGHLFGDELGVAADDVQQVVEVVRDPADQLAEALQPLRLLQPPFETLLVGFGPQPLSFGFGGQPLGDVTDSHRSHNPAFGGQRTQADLDGELAPVLSHRRQDQALTHLPWPRAGEIVGTVRGVGRAGRLGYQDLHRLADQLAVAVPEHARRLGVHHHDGPVRCHGQRGIRRRLEQAAEPFLSPFPFAQGRDQPGAHLLGAAAQCRELGRAGSGNLGVITARRDGVGRRAQRRKWCEQPAAYHHHTPDRDHRYHGTYRHQGRDQAALRTGEVGGGLGLRLGDLRLQVRHP